MIPLQSTATPTTTVWLRTSVEASGIAETGSAVHAGPRAANVLGCMLTTARSFQRYTVCRKQSVERESINVCRAGSDDSCPKRSVVERQTIMASCMKKDIFVNCLTR